MALPIDVTDPGVVNVETQAYPIVPPGLQSLPPEFARLLSASLFAPPIVPPSIQGGLVPRFVPIIEQPFVQLPLSQGSAVIAAQEVDVDTQNSIRQPVRDFLVTDVGNYELTQTNSYITLTVTMVVDADTGVAPTAATTRYRIFVSGAVLSDLGLSIQGRQVIFAGNITPPPAPTSIARFVRTIQFFNANSIYVAVTEFGTSFLPVGAPVTPQVGETMVLDIERRGSEAIFDTFATTADVFVDPNPPVAQTVSAPNLGFQGNIKANSGVVVPFVGSGINGPAFQGTFEVANQTYGQGLPGNVFQ